MTESPPNRLAGFKLKARDKGNLRESVAVADEIGDKHGYADRAPRKRPGRKPSPRQYQLHIKVLPHIGAAIAEEAQSRGLTQGHFVEMLWTFYKENGDNE
ncbi:MAG: chromosome partitioning protein ParB [Rhodobacteraceae bacterium]|nr:chromosome partitioning protein ParB [Paracoccaceae bacterium]MCY4141067.1 chromosome partitioning protein ParB [Paracoccaceae bacterium]